MTDRLAQLIATEADRLDVPPAPAADVLGRGRRLRRRRRASQAVAGLAVLAVIGGGALVVDSLSGGNGSPHPEVAGTPADLGAVFSIGATVYLDGGAISARIDDDMVTSLSYTSAGVVVGHERRVDDVTRFSLVTPSGSVRPIGAEGEWPVPATDPGRPYLAFVQEVDGIDTLLVHDVTTDEQVASVPVPDVETFGSLSLSGDLAYLSDGDGVLVVDWRTGESHRSTTLTDPRVAGGRAGTFDATGPTVLDADSGATLLSATVDSADVDGGSFDLSPDGRYAVLTLDPQVPKELRVYDVNAGTSVTVRGLGSYVGWAADDTLFTVSTTGVITQCSPTTGACTTSRPELDVLPDAPGRLRPKRMLLLGGLPYET